MGRSVGGLCTLVLMDVAGWVRYRLRSWLLLFVLLYTACGLVGGRVGGLVGAYTLLHYSASTSAVMRGGWDVWGAGCVGHVLCIS